MSSTQEIKCNQCLKNFTTANIPFKMSVCKHNVCQNCIKDLLTSGEKSLHCEFCGKFSEDLNFAQNQILLKEIPKIENNFKKKEKGVCDISGMANFQSNTQQQLLTKQQDQWNDGHHDDKKQIYIKEKMCLKHQKPIDIVCLSDLVALCPMCALFMGHKNHKLITKNDFKINIEQNQLKINEAKHQKYVHTSQKQVVQTKKKDFQKNKQKIGRMITDKKEQLKRELAVKIQGFRNTLKELQYKMNEQIQKQCDKISGMFLSLIGDESELGKQEKEFEQWVAHCENIVDLSYSQNTLEGLLQIFKGNGKIQQIENGKKIIKKIENLWEKSIDEVTSQIQSLLIYDRGEKNLSTLLNIVKLKSLQNKNQSHQTSGSIVSKNNKQDQSNQDNSFICDFSQDELDSLVDISKSSRPLTFSRASYKKVLEEQQNRSQRGHIKQKKPIKDISSRLSPNRPKFLSPSRKFTADESSIAHNKSIQNFQKFTGHRYTTSALVKTRSLDKSGFESILKKSTSPKKKYRNPEESIQQFLQSAQKNRKQEILDLSGFNFNDKNVADVLDEVYNKIKASNHKKQSRLNKKIKYLKLNDNHLTNQGVGSIVKYLGSCTNLNLSGNELNEEVLEIILSNRDQLAPLRLLNLSRNKINEKRAKLKLETLRKMGILIQI